MVEFVPFLSHDDNHLLRHIIVILVIFLVPNI